MLAFLSDLRIGWSRWLKAQQYEQAFWQRLSADVAAGTNDLDWYEWRAKQLGKFMAAAGAATADGKVLEIGSGPVGIVNFLDWGTRYAIDPLEHFYRTQPALVARRNPDVTYIDGTGERLPFEDGSCALVIIDNVIDHTYEPGKILDEIHRILRSDGHLYLSVNVHTRWGFLLHTALAVLQIDKGHPYTFTSQSLRRFLDEHRFAALAERVDDYHESKRADRSSSSLKARVKGYTGLSEFSHAVMCRKAAA
ncbi:MAG TPA: class I SAM-dependent methyltransferase [Vicinamibacterales bacterium]|nr:class I SAM-dependent methyltransferase [Vicinamibacterales bacterium]